MGSDRKKELKSQMGTFNALLATYFQCQQTAVIKTSTIHHLNHLDCFPVNCYTNKFQKDITEYSSHR